MGKGFPQYAAYLMGDQSVAIAAIEAKMNAAVINQKVFTANGNFVIPEGVTKVYITATAAGDNGAAGTAGTGNAGGVNGPGGVGGKGGKGGQGVIDYPVEVTPGETVAITVGAGNTVFKGLTLVKGAGDGENVDYHVPWVSMGMNGSCGGSSVFGPRVYGGVGGYGPPIGGGVAPGGTGGAGGNAVAYGQGGGGGGGGGGVVAPATPVYSGGSAGGAGTGAPGCLIVRW